MMEIMIYAIKEWFQLSQFLHKPVRVLEPVQHVIYVKLKGSCLVIAFLAKASLIKLNKPNSS